MRICSFRSGSLDLLVLLDQAKRTRTFLDQAKRTENEQKGQREQSTSEATVAKAPIAQGHEKADKQETPTIKHDCLSVRPNQNRSRRKEERQRTWPSAFAGLPSPQ